MNRRASPSGPREEDVAAALTGDVPLPSIRAAGRSVVGDVVSARMEGHGGSLDQLTHALLDGDADLLEEQLQSFVSNLLSYHDPGAVNPERVYQGFLVELLAVLEPAYQVRSNRESGQGRPNLMIRPMRPGKGVGMELPAERRWHRHSPRG